MELPAEIVEEAKEFYQSIQGKPVRKAIWLEDDRGFWEPVEISQATREVLLTKGWIYHCGYCGYMSSRIATEESPNQPVKVAAYHAKRDPNQFPALVRLVGILEKRLEFGQADS